MDSKINIDELLDNHMKKYIETIDNNFTGIFLSGLFSGIILSYSGFLGCITGLGTGILVGYKYRSTTCNIVNFIEKTFCHVIGNEKVFALKKNKKKK